MEALTVLKQVFPKIKCMRELQETTLSETKCIHNNIGSETVNCNLWLLKWACY